MEAMYKAFREGFVAGNWTIEELRAAEAQCWKSLDGTRARPDRSESIEVRLRAIRDELNARGQK